MAIQSMTGFGKGECEGTNYSLSVEMKSVNNRFKDIRFKMGSVFNSQEIPLKKKIESHFTRGSFDIYVTYKKNAAKQEELELDYDKINKFVSRMKEALGENADALKASPTDFMRSDFYKEDESKEEELISLMNTAFDQAAEELVISRQEEGQKLVATLRKHKEQYISSFEKIPPLKETYQDKLKDKIKKRFEKDGSELGIDEPRFLQEVIYYLEKLDIDEEINRINIHLEKLDKVLSETGEIGRQIDFLVQELNRETNTIGSKSGASDISECVVQMKVQLEKIREQALNLQ